MFQYLRSKKRVLMELNYKTPFEKRNNLSVWTYKDATVIPLKRFKEDNLWFGRGGVIDNEGNYIRCSELPQGVSGSYDYGEVTYRDESVMYAGYLINHWGHFLVQDIARLWYCLEHKVDKIIFFVDSLENREIVGNMKEFLSLLDIFEKIELINRPTKYREIIIPEMSYLGREYYSDAYLNTIEKVCNCIDKNAEWISHDKIYFSRKLFKEKEKNEIGHDMLDDYFSKNGYLVIAPENITLSYMIYLIRHAKVIAACSGSAAHNVLFANQGANVLIIEKNVLINHTQIDIDRMKRLSSEYIDANICIYPVAHNRGPYILAFPGKLEQFSYDHSMLKPDSAFLSSKYLNKCFKNYMKVYHLYYGYQWFSDNWMLEYIYALREAYLESMEIYGDYLRGAKPFNLFGYFEVQGIKYVIKKLIR